MQTPGKQARHACPASTAAGAAGGKIEGPQFRWKSKQKEMVRGTRQHTARESIWRQVRKAENKGTREEDVARS